MQRPHPGKRAGLLRLRPQRIDAGRGKCLITSGKIFADDVERGTARLLDRRDVNLL